MAIETLQELERVAAMGEIESAMYELRIQRRDLSIKQAAERGPRFYVRVRHRTNTQNIVLPVDDNGTFWFRSGPGPQQELVFKSILGVSGQIKVFVHDPSGMSRTREYDLETYTSFDVQGGDDCNIALFTGREDAERTSAES